MRRAYVNYRRGPGAFKVDYALEGGVAWAHEGSRSAGTLHLGGTVEEIAAAERDVAAGRMPERPFVLVGQQYLADKARSAGDVHPLCAYAHVPAGYTGDATEAITAQIERYAPRVPRPDPGDVRADPDRDEPAQRELRRRRRRHRRQ